MATIPIYNPIVPFLGQICGGLKPDLIVKIKGYILGSSERCMIDFRSNPALSINEDIIMHLSVRCDEKVIVRNNFENGSWGTEDRFGGNPIKANQMFEISIQVRNYDFKLSINGKHFCNFNHRLPCNLAQYIHVTGNCLIDHILLEQNTQPIINVIQAPSVYYSDGHSIHNTLD